MPERTVQQDIERGRQAARMLDDAVFNGAVEDARQRFYEEWLSAGTPADREAAWAKTHALNAVGDSLRRTVSEGDFAEEALRRSQ